ncbi:MAG: GyrI-like domain-containing protein [Bacteroidia bacterium]
MSANSIINTLHFIEENYARAISVEEIEQVSCYSYRNFQRIFKHICNETIGSFQKRLKLENAYKMLLYNHEPVNNIGYDVGFETPSAFAKAFKQHFGFTPSEVRKHKEVIFTQNDIVLTTPEDILPYKAVIMPQEEVYFSRVIAAYDSPEIETHWAKFMQFGFPPQSKFYGIIADEPCITEDIRCRYDACCDTSPLLKNLPKKKIFGGKYIQFTHTGTYDTLDETYQKIYTQWMINADLEFSNSPHIEYYEPHNSQADLNKTHIFIPIL